MHVRRCIACLCFPLLLVAVSPSGSRAATAAASPAPAGLAGDWNGTLTFGGSQLRLVLHLTARPGGGLAATMDSPDQGARGLPVDTVVVHGDTLRLDLPKLHAGYSGVIAAGGAAIHGSWTQGGTVLALDLARGAAAEARRPQDPVPPYPYDEEQVTVVNRAADVTLAGTLTRPRGPGPFPAVLLISGSGPQNRDEEIFGHRPFRVIADRLTRHGFAVLRLDDRGLGGSTGDFARATLEDFVSDAGAAVAFLAARPDVDHARIGLVGHSEGALVAPLVAVGGGATPGAAGARPVAFVVLLAGPGVPGDSLLGLQGARLMQAGGASPGMIEWNQRLQRGMFRIVKTAPDSTAMRLALQRVIADALPRLPAEAQGRITAQSLAGQVPMVMSPWFRSFVAYDPRPTLRRLRCPVLAMTGAKDLQVPARENLPAIAAALAAGGNREARTLEMPGLNHLFQSAGSGLVSEYGTIEETFAPAALDTLTTWLEAHAGGPAGR
jgi:hypothetical protein